jgi:hypothetical protein
MDYLGMFPSGSRGKVRFMGMAAVLLGQVDDLIQVAMGIHGAFSVGSAVGAQLDVLGDFFGIPRQYGWNDTTYREFMRKKLEIWRWDGTNETVHTVLTGQPGAQMIDNGDCTVTIIPASGVFPVPAGIRTIHQ